MEENRNRTYKYFEQICKIPRQTGDEEAISTFLMNFAAIRGLEAKRDRQNNVLIKKPSLIPGYAGPTVIIQGHMDMVYEKASDSVHNYQEGIRILNQDGYLTSSDRTSLGADNGVEVAYVMALLDRDDILLPNLEVLITTGEEAGLLGVKNLELTEVKGNYLINLDAEEEGVFFTSCAGGVRTALALPLEYELAKGQVRVSLSIKGVSGGHSGLDIGLDKANAIQLLGRILYKTGGLARVISIESPGKANAIASRGKIMYLSSGENLDKLKEQFKLLEQQMKIEYSDTDQISFVIEEEKGVFHDMSVFTENTVKKITEMITFLPCGPLHRMRQDLTMVQTSSNIGDMSMKNGKLTFLSSSRSSVSSHKGEIKETMKVIAGALGADCMFFGEYPQWEYRKQSRLREICRKVYKKYSGREPAFIGIHAGIECGYLAEKLGSEIDMISFGASMSQVHTPREKVSLQSFYNTEEILIEILKEISISG